MIFLCDYRHSEYLFTEMSRQPSLKDNNPNKRARNDSSVHTGDLSKLNGLLDSISNDESALHQAISLILNKGVFKNALTEVLVPEVTSLRTEVNDLKLKVDDMEQYTRRKCLKISGILENSNDNIDQLVFNVVNNSVLTENEEKIKIKDISRSHRVGKFNSYSHRRPRA